MSAPDPFGTPGWDALAAMRENVDRQARAEQERQEAEVLRAAGAL